MLQYLFREGPEDPELGEDVMRVMNQVMLHLHQIATFRAYFSLLSP